METKNETQKIEKQALNIFVSLAAIVFTASLSYCYLSGRLMEMGFVFGAVAVLALLVINTYQKINNNS